MLNNRKSLGSESFVDGLTEEDVDSAWEDLLKDGEHDGNEAVGKERGKVVGRGINPTEKEVVITVWETLGF